MYTITKEFAFEASHQLRGLPDGHQCMRLHGHSYVVELELTGETLDDTGFLVDYGDLQPFGDWIKRQFDHAHLNDQMRQPTAENLAKALWGVAGDQLELHRSAHVWSWAVTVRETAKTSATYAGSNATFAPVLHPEGLEAVADGQ